MKTFFLAFLAFDAASILHDSCYDKDVRMEFRLSCNHLLYVILSNENSKEYPLSNILGIVSDYSSSCGQCTHFYSTEKCTVDWYSFSSSSNYPDSLALAASLAPYPEYSLHQEYKESCIPVTYNFTYSNCDCSDPKNYNFEDEGRFEIFQGQIKPY